MQHTRTTPPRRTRAALRALLLLGALAWPLSAGQAQDEPGQDAPVQLANIEGTRIDKATLACTLLKTAVTGYNAAPGAEAKLEALLPGQVALNGAMADLIAAAQTETGVSVDNVDPGQLHQAIQAMQAEFGALEAAQQAEQTGTPVSEWTDTDITRTFLGVASIADPSGVLGVAAAYTYPVCGTPEAERSNGGFCWRASTPRGVGSLPSDFGRLGNCPAGMTNMGLHCQGEVKIQPSHSRVADCPAGFVNVGANCHRDGEIRSAPSKTPSCQSGYTNTGLTCYRGPDSYGKGCTTIFGKYPCRAGYTDMGCHCQRWAHSTSLATASCPSGYFLNTTSGRCHQNCPSEFTNTGEYCQRWVQTKGWDAMTCPKGYFRAGARCYADCAPGFTSIGELCVNKNAIAGIDAMKCPDGEFKNAEGRCYKNGACGSDIAADGTRRPREMNAGLCYPACKPDETGVGPVCWSSCAKSKYKLECGAGCAESELDCGMATTDMVAAPFEVVISAASLYTATAGTAARKAASVAARAAAREAARAAAREAADAAARAAARQALRRLADQTVEALDDDALDALIRWSDDIGEPAAAAPDPAAQARLAQEVEDRLTAQGADRLDEFEDALSSASLPDLDDSAPVVLPPRPDRAANQGRAASDRLGDRAARALARRIDDMDAAQLRFAQWTNANQRRFVELLKTNVFDPTRRGVQRVVRGGQTVWNFPNNTLRKRYELYNAFQIEKGKIGLDPLIAVGRAARSCTKLGISLAQQAE